MPVGWGEVPITEILSTFIGSYQGLLIMELRSRYFESIEESKENLEGILLECENSGKEIDINSDTH